MTPRRPKFILAMLLLMLAGCNSDAPQSKITGVYHGVYRRIVDDNTVLAFQVDGAVAPDGNGYFIYTAVGQGATAGPSDVAVIPDLWFKATLYPHWEEISPSANYDYGGLTAVIRDDPTVPGGHSILAYQGYIDWENRFRLVIGAESDQPRSLASLAGNYQGPDLNRQDFVSATLDATGKLTGTDSAGCQISTELSQVNGQNLYAVQVAIEGPLGCGDTLSGVAYVESEDTTLNFAGSGTYLYVLGANDAETRAMAMVLKLQ